MACGHGFAENLNGTDLTPRVLAALPFGTRVMLVGARPRVVRRAAHRMMQRWPHLDICAYHDGYSGGSRALLELSDLKPDVVLVAMGNPRQEQWISQAVEAHPSAVFLGVGALFDFFADAVPRAPEQVRRLKLEWAFRLAQEPQRLWRRYTVEIFVVMLALLASPRNT
jgi:alpha-1,3-mannosyltransferase